jgi:catechol 2,3-dioxygenase-like lactoylglutathione lyase family enzyme
MAMYSHVTVGTNDMARARAFYDAVLATLGTASFTQGKHHTGYGKTRGDQFWVLSPFDRQPATVGNGTHVAFLAPSRASVDAFHAAAMAHGAADEGAPGLRPHYHPSYYGAYIRDPDGNKIQAVCHDPEE